MRKAIGAVRGDIVTQFLTEAMTLSGIGGAIGVIVGLLIALGARKFTPLPTATPLWSIVLGLGRVHLDRACSSASTPRTKRPRRM